jgi:hypothetical protein
VADECNYRLGSRCSGISRAQAFSIGLLRNVSFVSKQRGFECIRPHHQSLCMNGALTMSESHTLPSKYRINFHYHVLRNERGERTATDRRPVDESLAFR